MEMAKLRFMIIPLLKFSIVEVLKCRQEKICEVMLGYVLRRVERIRLLATSWTAGTRPDHRAVGGKDCVSR